MIYIGKENKLLVPVGAVVAVAGSLILTIFAVASWCVSISMKLDAAASESIKVSVVENRLTRIETILEIQFPHAAKTAMEKLSQ